MRQAGFAFVVVLLLAASSAIGRSAFDPFARVQKGMFEQQVVIIVGFPTAEGLYRPRLDRLLGMIGLGDAYRTYFYRGMGRVLFVGGSPLVQTGRVTKVEVDPAEPGIPH